MGEIVLEVGGSTPHLAEEGTVLTVRVAVVGVVVVVIAEEEEEEEEEEMTLVLVVQDEEEEEEEGREDVIVLQSRECWVEEEEEEEVEMEQAEEITGQVEGVKEDEDEDEVKEIPRGKGTFSSLFSAGRQIGSSNCMINCGLPMIISQISSIATNLQFC